MATEVIPAADVDDDKQTVTLRLGDVCSKIGSGATPTGGSNAYLDAGPYALIRSQNVYNEGFRKQGLAFIDDDQAAGLQNVEVKAGDVLLNITGDSVARCCTVDVTVLPARVNQHVAIIRPNPEVLDPLYLRYWLISPATQALLLSWAGAGATRNALTKAMIESLQVRAPRDVDQQRDVANLLSSIDARIDHNVRCLHGLADLLREVLIDAQADSGGEAVMVGDIGVLRRDSRNPDEMDRDTPYIGLEHMPRRDVVLSRWATVEKVASDKVAFSPGEILFGKLRPNFHKVGVAVVEGVCSSDILVVRPKVVEDRGLLLAMLSSDDLIAHAVQSADGTRMPRVSWQSLSKFQFRITPSARRLINEIGDSLWLASSRMVTENQALADLRAALIPGLMSGRVRVGPAELER